MKKYWKRLFSDLPMLGAVAILSGCNTLIVAPYPEFGSKPVKVAVASKPLEFILESNTELSGFRETLQPFSYPNSQIYLTGGGSNAVATGGLAFGVIGAVVALKVQEEQNAKLASGISPEQLSARFDDELLSALRAQALSVAGAEKFSFGSNEEQADIRLLPSAILIVGDGGKSSLMFTVKVAFRLTSGAGHGAKIYRYYGVRERLLSGPDGWASDGAERIKAESRTAMNALARVVLADAAGAYKSVWRAAAPKTISWQRNKSSEPVRLVELERTNAHLFLSPMWSGGPMEYAVFVVERDLGIASE